jgi:hypothetical protein
MVLNSISSWKCLGQKLVKPVIGSVWAFAGQLSASIGCCLPTNVAGNAMSSPQQTSLDFTRANNLLHLPLFKCLPLVHPPERCDQHSVGGIDRRTNAKWTSFYRCLVVLRCIRGAQNRQSRAAQDHRVPCLRWCIVQAVHTRSRGSRASCRFRPSLEASFERFCQLARSRYG